MRFFFLHRALEAILDQNLCGFFAKNNCLGYEPEQKINLGEKNHLWGPGRPFFVTLGALPKIWIVCQKYGSHAFKAFSSSNPVMWTLEGVCQKQGSITIFEQVPAFKAKSSHPVISTLEAACQIYGSIHILGKQPWVNFLGNFGRVKGEKKHPVFGFLASSHILLIHFAKKMRQNGQLCPQQGQKKFTAGYMGSPLPKG